QRNKLKEGGGYRYPHNDPSGFVRQEYRPPEIAGEIGAVARRVYYRPSPHGEEADVGRRLRALWGDAPYDTQEWWEFEKFRDPLAGGQGHGGVGRRLPLGAEDRRDQGDRRGRVAVPDGGDEPMDERGEGALPQRRHVVDVDADLEREPIGGAGRHRPRDERVE